MMDLEKLLGEIERFRSEVGLTEATFGLRASNDTRLIDRLRRGASSHRIHERVEKFLADERAKRKEAAE